MSRRDKLGSVTTPVKLALIEMDQFGALTNSIKSNMWVSCNGSRFHNATIRTLMAWQLAILSVNREIPDKQFVRLNDIGKKLAKAVKEERDARKAALDASEKIFAEMAQIKNVGQKADA